MHESESQKLKLLMVGMSAYIYLLNPITVLKVPRIDEDDGITEANREATRTEASAYKLLGHHAVAEEIDRTASQESFFTSRGVRINADFYACFTYTTL